MWVLSSHGWYLNPGDLDKIKGVSVDRDEKKSKDGPLAHFHFKREKDEENPQSSLGSSCQCAGGKPGECSLLDFSGKQDVRLYSSSE